MVDLIKPDFTELKPRITVIGVGGAGGNAVANMIASGLEGVDFIVANTDAQALIKSPAGTRIQLGLRITQGLGAGARPEIGRAAAQESLEQIERALDGSHMCFITAGMGGGTGTGAAPEIARVAREMGILTVGVVTKPFHFEGARRMRAAEAGITELARHVDTLIIIPNQNLFLVANARTGLKEAFQIADQVLHQGVRGITDLMVMPGLINLDFADVRTVMSEMGKAMMGTGEAEGEGRALEAAARAIANPLLDEVSMRGAKGVIVNITGGDDLGLMEVEEAVEHIRAQVDPEANIIFGSAFDPALEGRVRVAVVATGIEGDQPALALDEPAGHRPAGRLSVAAPAAGAPPSRLAVPTVALGAGLPASAVPAGAAAPAAGAVIPDAGPVRDQGDPLAMPPAPVAPAAAAAPVSAEGPVAPAIAVEDVTGQDGPVPAAAGDGPAAGPTPILLRAAVPDAGHGAAMPAAAPADEAALAAPEPAAVPLPVPDPLRIAPADFAPASARRAAERSERAPTLFERMMGLGRATPRAETASGSVTPAAAAPPPQAEEQDDDIAIPAALRRQSNG
jgi:cell division protein FtsZ